MARKARQLEAFGVYIVHQSASDNKLLFKNDRDRERFLLILKQTKSRYGYQLYGYCVDEPHAYDLLIDANGNDLSKVMKSINIALALYTSIDGKLFRDRYKSIHLESDKAIIEAVERFKEKQMRSQLNKRFKIFEEDINLLDVYTVCDLKEKEPSSACMVSLEEAQVALANIADREQETLSDLMRDKVKRDKLILKFRRESTLSLKELGQLFGGLSESTICKILKEQCQ
jgi:hypothetical protein